MELRFVSQPLGIFSSLVESIKIFLFAIRKLFWIGAVAISVLILGGYFLNRAIFCVHPNSVILGILLLLAIVFIYAETTLFFSIQQKAEKQTVSIGKALVFAAKKLGVIFPAYIIATIFYLAYFVILNLMKITLTSGLIFAGFGINALFFILFSIFMPAIIMGNEGVISCFIKSIAWTGRHFFKTLGMRVASSLVIMGIMALLFLIGAAFHVQELAALSSSASLLEKMTVIDKKGWIELIILFISLFWGTSVLSVWYYQLKLRS